MSHGWLTDSAARRRSPDLTLFFFRQLEGIARPERLFCHDHCDDEFKRILLDLLQIGDRFLGSIEQHVEER